MSNIEEKLCPFDKDPCIRVRCAVWSADDETCALALIPRALLRSRGVARQTERSSSSGLSGKYRDPLFD